MMEEYDDKYECQKCGGTNKIGRGSTDGGYISVCFTECSECGHKDFWAYGHFESENKVEIFKQKYDGEGIVDIGRDIYEAFDFRFNEKANAITADEHGIPKGHFIVTLEYFPEKIKGDL